MLIVKYSKNIIEQLKPLPFFSRKSVSQIADQYNLKTGTVDSYIKKLLASRELIQLKKGFYITDESLKKNRTDTSFIFFLANVLRTPSYVSMWSALQYYNLATEAINTTTSVTSQVTRSYNSMVGNFVYRSIKKDLFFGFLLVKGNFDFFIATPAKALFDIIYFKTNQFRSIRLKKLAQIIADLRIDLDEFDINERKNFYALMKKYCK